ncbi:surface protein [Treponema bryantii]|uniref:Surface protein n=1 Tax=Treponema bryantii TaxID=163 RepID=A0A1H9EBZ4_9SPIR|nr:BspA family leucine-rich repeat surface protein [Treponema bryantii]SEQ22508.1 surface protein [Treponema bryantii]
MKNYFKNFAALVLSVLLVAGITACNNEFDSGNINESPKGQIILDNDFVTIRMVNNEARAITEQIPYTKEDWAYNTTTVTYGGVSDTTEFYSKNSSINVECKKEGEYTFKSTAYKADKETIIATSDPVIKNVTFANGDFDLTITYTNFESYEVTAGVTVTIENKWEKETAILSKNWFNNKNAPSKSSVKSISFIKKAYTGPFTKTWSGGENVTVYYNSNDGSIVVSAAGLTIFAPKDCSGFFNAFQCVESIDLKNFDTSNVTSMRRMFGSSNDLSCINLTTLDVSNFDTFNVTDMSEMFYKCKKLTTLDISSFDTSNVTNMSSMFSMSNLANLDLSNFNTSKVTNMFCMFEFCSNLTSLDLSNFDTSNVTNMARMFFMCSNLVNLDISNFDTFNVTNMAEMFNYCRNLASLDLSNFDTSNVTNMTGMFGQCDKLASLALSNFDTSNVTNMSSMFSNCHNLASLDLRNFDTSNVTNMSNMFCQCGIASLDLSNFDTSNVTNMAYMFFQCDIASLDVSNFDTSKVTDMSYMFYNCYNIRTLDLRNFDTSSVTRKDSMFYLTISTLKVIYTPATWTLGTDWPSGITFTTK